MNFYSPTIPVVPQITVNGSYPVYPGTTTTFHMSATGPGGTTTCPFSTVIVVPNHWRRDVSHLFTSIYVDDSDTAIATNKYSAEANCAALGGRLPTATELLNIYYTRNSYGAPFNVAAGVYWSSDTCGTGWFVIRHFWYNANGGCTTVDYGANSRCVK